MNVIKRIIVLILLCLVLFGCSNTANPEEMEFLKTLKEEINKNVDKPSGFAKEIFNEGISEIEDEAIKKEAIEIYNVYVLDYLEEYPIFTSTFIEEPNKIINEQYLNDEVKSKIMINYNPIFEVLSEQDLKMKIIPEYKDKIKKGESLNIVTTYLEENEYDYEFLGPLLILNDEGIVIESEFSISVDRIFQVEDKEGNVLSPQKYLKEYAMKIQEEIDKYTEKYEGEIRNDKLIKIGMTKNEVIDRKGKPQTINKTTTRYTIKEQWVYNNGYLYFEDDILTTIQETIN